MENIAARMPVNLNVFVNSEQEYSELTTEYYVTQVNETKFEILKRYENLEMIGFGAQGVVW